MLDVITDFWKPVKKPTPQGALDLQALRVGSALSFGTVPQALLSGARFRVANINTYQFGEERMTSFVLSGATEDVVSLIVASADGESYLAISRRIPLTDRLRMFDPIELEAVAEQPDAMKLTCREIDANWRHWVVSAYKKEISGLRGSMVKGDLRFSAASAGTAPEPFDYVLLTSDSNEYAIEVERYADGRLEVYATVYRRVSDVVELDHGTTGAPLLEVVKPAAAPVAAPIVPVVAKPEPIVAPAEPVIKAAQEDPFASASPVAPVAAAPEASAQKEATAKPLPVKEEPVQKEAPTLAPSFPSFFTPPTPTQENRIMAQNGSINENERAKPAFGTVPSNIRQEIKSVTNRVEMENDAIECELAVASKIIEEAIRNEIRLSDVVRRIIALPVANPDSVQIPIQLADNDYQLLAIRYSLPVADRNAIKNRIIEEINDFSGNKQ